MFITYFNIIFIFYVHTASSRIYLFDSRNAENDHHFHLNHYPPVPVSPRPEIVEKPQIMYHNQKLTSKPMKHKCERNFGSMFGTKIQKLLCIEKMRHDQLSADSDTGNIKNYVDKKWVPNKMISSDYIDFNDLFRHEREDRFSHDYFDVNDLLRAMGNQRAVPVDYFEIAGKIKLSKDKNVSKFNTQYFQDGLTKRTKWGKYKSIAIGDNFNSEEVIEMPKNLMNDNYVLLRDGAGVFDVTEDYTDGRRRLPYFLPKRYPYEPSDLDHLGNYWFNGPRRQYKDGNAFGKMK